MRTPESELAGTYLHNIAFDQAVARDAHAIHECARSGVMIFYFIPSIRQLANSGVQAAYSQVFQEDITLATAPNCHIREQFKTALSSPYSGHIQFRDSAVIGFGAFEGV